MRTPSKRLVARARLSVLAIAAAVIAATLVPTASASATTPAPTPTPTRHTLAMGSFAASSYAAQAEHLPGGLTTALKRDLHESPSQYLADSAAAAQAVKVVASLKGSGVDVLGSKISGTSLTVNVASAADSAAVSAAGATPVVGSPVVPDFTDQSFHSVDAPAPAYGGQGYFFQNSAQAQANSLDGFRCSIGFSGYSANAAQFVTAGHCATAIAPAETAQLITQDAPTNNGGTIQIGPTQLGNMAGTEGAYGNNLDYGIVGEATSATVTPQASLYTWGGSTGGPLDTAALPVTGETAALVGANLCKSGSTSGWTCGSVLAVDTPVPVCADGETGDCSDHTVNSIIASTCLLPGDSGGGAVIGQLAAGIDSGSSFPANSCANGGPSNNPTYDSVFFPMVATTAGRTTFSVTGQVGSNWTLLTAPAVASPISGATVSSSAAMSGTLATIQSGITLTLFLDGSSTAFASAAGTANWSIPLTGLSQGAHTYSLVETLNGNQISVTAGNFIEAVTSTATVTSPGSGAKVYPNSVMTGTITSPTPGSTALLYLDGATTAYAQVGASAGSFTIPLTGIAVGPHTYSVAAGVGSVPGTMVTGSFVETAFNSTPSGFIDTATTGPGTITVRGWAYDPGTTGAISVAVTVDGTAQSPVTANVDYPNFNAAFPGYGDDHGYTVSLASVGGGSHAVCISAVNAGVGPNSPAICRTVTVPTGNPFGVIDTAVGSPSAITLTGWFIDPDTASPISVHYTVDGNASSGSVLAGGDKPGLDPYYPGYGDAHDFTIALMTESGGSHTVCVNGVNVGGGSDSAPICRLVNVPTGNPIGVIDTAVGGPSAITVTGWMLDPDTYNPISVAWTVDGRAPSSGPTSVVAGGDKPGLDPYYPGYGDDHDYTIALTSLTGGPHTVCVHGINVLGGVDSAPICRSVTVPTGSPVGVIDTAVAIPGAITVTGWTLDPDTYSPISVKYSVDGITASAIVTAGGDKPGLDPYYPGYGDAHDYTISIAGLAGGSHTICVQELNVGGGSNTTICRTATVPTGNPVGVIDTAVGGPSSIIVNGWMLDPDTYSPISVGWTVDGTAPTSGATSVVANGDKPGLDPYYPGYGDDHDYTITLTQTGTHTVCVFGMNVGGGTDSTRICRVVTVPSGPPIGVIDTVVTAPEAITVTGWMLDPDTYAPISVGWSVDGVASTSPASVVAGGDKPGLDPYYPGYGDDHDYTVAVTLPTGGSHTICIYGINVGAGANSAPICRTVSLATGNPFGVIDNATITSNNLHVDGWMIDPDTSSPISVNVFVDGNPVPTTIAAGGNKPGLDPYYPGYGNAHDFSADIANTYSGTHRVCVVGLNVGGGINGPAICRSLTVAAG